MIILNLLRQSVLWIVNAAAKSIFKIRGGLTSLPFATILQKTFSFYKSVANILILDIIANLPPNMTHKTFK